MAELSSFKVVVAEADAARQELATANLRLSQAEEKLRVDYEAEAATSKQLQASLDAATRDGCRTSGLLQAAEVGAGIPLAFSAALCCSKP